MVNSVLKLPNVIPCVLIVKFKILIVFVENVLMVISRWQVLVVNVMLFVKLVEKNSGVILVLTNII